MTPLLAWLQNNLRVFRDGQLVYGGRPAHSHAAAEHSDAYSSAEHMHMDLPGLMACLEGDLALPPMQWQAQHTTPQHAAHSTQTQMRRQQQQPAAGRCLQQPEVCVPAAKAGPGPEAAAASAADGMAAERSLRSERGGHALMRLVASVLQASGA